MLRFIHISDTHIGAKQNFLCHDVNTFEKCQQLIEYINNLEIELDFVIHTGDLVGEHKEQALTLAAKLFATLKYPLICIPGNYENSVMLKSLNRLPHQAELFGERGSFYFETEQLNFIGINSSQYPATHGIIDSEDLIFIQKFLSNTTKKSLFFTHFPAISLDCPWIDETMLLKNGLDFHHLLVKYSNKVAAVFNGHIHKAITTVKDGVLYSSVASVFCQYPAWPNNLPPGEESHHQHCFNLVTAGTNQLIIKECSF